MKRLISAIMALLFIGSASWADFVRGSQTIAAYGGFGGSSTQYDFKPGDQRTVTGAGAAFGAQYLYYVKSSPAVAIGADLTQALNGNRQSDATLTGYDTTAHLRSLVGLVMARLAYPRGEVRPYIFFGAGMHHSHQELSARPLSGNSWPGGGAESRTLIDERQTSAAIGYGVGLELFPPDAFFIGTEVRAVKLLGMNTDDNTALRAAGFAADETTTLTQGYVLMHVGWKF